MDVRSVVIGVYFLFMAAGALGECVTVEQNYKSSSRNVRVTAVREKKLLKDVKKPGEQKENFACAQSTAT